MSGLQTASLIGPLTTTFVPPSTCNFLTAGAGKSNLLFINVGLGGHASLDCNPSGFDAYAYIAVGGLQYYSPGWICPQSWELVPSQIASSFVSGARLSTASGETVGICCAPGFTLPYDFTDPGLAVCQRSMLTSSEAVAIVTEEELLPSTTPVGPAMVFESYVQIRWRGIDIASPTSTSASIPSTPSSSTTSPVTSPASITPISRTTASSGHDAPGISGNADGNCNGNAGSVGFCIIQISSSSPSHENMRRSATILWAIFFFHTICILTSSC